MFYRSLDCNILLTIIDLFASFYRKISVLDVSVIVEIGSSSMFILNSSGLRTSDCQISVQLLVFLGRQNKQTCPQCVLCSTIFNLNYSLRLSVFVLNHFEDRLSKIVFLVFLI